MEHRSNCISLRSNCEYAMGKVLIQETEQFIMDVLILALEMGGFSVMGSLGLEPDFMEKIADYRPHVVVLDYRLDGKKAAEICALIKEKYPCLPVLALSCNSNIHLDYDKHGFDDYIRKPFDIEELYTILRKYIAKSEACEEEISDL